MVCQAVQGEGSEVRRFGIPPVSEVKRVIADREANIVERMKHLFYARHFEGAEAVDALRGGLGDKSVLLVHEVAYVMGQVGDKSAVPILLGLLRDTTEHCMVRHEAAEALGALKDSSEEVVSALAHYSKDPSAPVAETCQLALRSILEDLRSQNAEDSEKSATAAASTPFYLYNGAENQRFVTVDPVAKGDRHAHLKSLSVKQLREILLDAQTDLYERYEALFALRDAGTDESTSAIVEAMETDQSSALFRHEVAFVLGQIQSSRATQALVKCLENMTEHPMARHEAALALGSVIAATSDGDLQNRKNIDVLRKYAQDEEPIVAESCQVALDNIEAEAC